MHKIFDMKRSTKIGKAEYSLGSLGSLLSFDGDFFTHGGHDHNVDILVLLNEQLVDSVTNFTIGNLDIILGVALFVHQGKETVIGNVKL